MPIPKLIAGPYVMPRCRVGDRIACEYRGVEVIVVGISDAPVPWPYGTIDGRGGRGHALVVYDGLIDALRVESASAIAYHWGVTITTVRRWRRSIGVPTHTTGSHEMHRRHAGRPRRIVR